MIHTAAMIHAAVIDTAAIDAPVTTMSHYCAMGAGTTSPVYATGAHDSTPPRMVREAYRVLRGFKTRGMAILLVEQNVHAALRFANRAYVLRQG